MYVHILLPDETESKDEDEEAKLNAAVRWAAHPHLCKLIISELSASRLLHETARYIKYIYHRDDKSK